MSEYVLDLYHIWRNCKLVYYQVYTTVLQYTRLWMVSGRYLIIHLHGSYKPLLFCGKTLKVRLTTFKHFNKGYVKTHICEILIFSYNLSWVIWGHV